MHSLRLVREDDDMAAVKEEQRGVKDRLSETIRETVRPHVIPGKNIDALVEALVKVLRSDYVVGIRRPRPRRETDRALSMRLPPVGSTWTTTHRGRTYTLRVLGEHLLECSCGDDDVKRFESLKAAAVHICGYSPSVGGRRFFFGLATNDEIAEQLRKK
jgi:hypothetical protein